MFQFIYAGKKNRRKDLPFTFSRKGEGFTIIELLAVIAIIGVLAAIVLVRTGSARKEGEDAAVKTALREVRNAAELYYNKEETYEGVCDASNTTLSDEDDFGRIKDYITKYNGSNGVIGCKDDEAGYAAISNLNLGNCWCVDSEGASREIELKASNCREELTTITCP